MNDPVAQVPLSIGQEAMWIVWQRDPEQWIHIIPSPFAVHGTIDPVCLDHAVTALGQAFPQLRGRVTASTRGPVLDWSDAPHIPVRESTTSLPRDEAVRRVWQAPFDLRHGPLARVDLLHGPDYTVLVLAVHHLVSDGTSVLILADALRRAYAGESLSAGDPVPALRAFAERSRELADTSAGEAHRVFWRTALGQKAPGSLLLRNMDEPAYTVFSELLPADLMARLRARAEELGISFVTVLLGAYYALLHRHSGAEDLLVFLPFHGRTDEALRDRVGYFVNLLPLRLMVHERDTYAELLSRVRSRMKDGVRHGDLPLPAVMRAAGLIGPDAHARTHQTVFQYWNNGRRDGVDLTELRLEASGSSAVLSLLDNESSAGFPLTLMVREERTETHVLWKDPTGAVGPAQVSALASGYREVLEAIAADPHSPLPAADPGTALGIRAAEPAPGTTPAPSAPPSSVPAAPIPDAPAQVAPVKLAAMRQVWEDALGIEGIDERDSFFELGGHSLLAERLTLAVSDRFGCEVPLRTLFEHPRLSEFTATVLPATTEAVATDATSVPDPVPASAFQQRVWLAEQLEPGRGAYNVPMAWRVEGDGLNRAALQRTLALLVERHEILRTAFHEREGRPWQVVGPPWEPEVRHIDLRDRPDPEAALHDWLHASSMENFDLASGRLLTAALVETGREGQVFFLCIHHLLWDGESTGVFLKELAANYSLDEPAWAPGGPTPPTGPVMIRQAAPEQARLWSAAQHERPGVSISLRLSYLPDDEALQEAVHRVTLAHDALRTHLGVTGDRVVQHVRTETAVTPVRLPVQPPTGIAEVPDLLRDWAAEPFDLTRGPLFRIAVLPEDSGGGWLFLAGHRAVLDVWSLRLVAQQLLATLSDAAPIEPSSFPDWLEGNARQKTAKELEARAAALRPAAEALGLPERRARKTDDPHHEYEEGVITFAVPSEQAMREAAERLGIVDRDLLLAAFAALLGWYTGRQDLLVGLAHGARLSSDRHVVGPLATVLPVRLRPEVGEDFATLASRTAAEVAEATAHSGTPAEELMRLVDPSRTDRSAPPTEVFFDCDEHDSHGDHGDSADESGPAVPAFAADAIRSVEETPGGQEAYAVALRLRHRLGRLEGRFVFDARYFDHDQMQTMAEHYLRLIALFVEAPGRAIGEADPLTEAERHTQVAVWNGTEADYPRTPVHELIRRHALARPHAIAITADRTELTYRELLEDAEVVARGLVTAGVRSGDLVALVLPRGAEQALTMLAVLLAGAAYLPVDPAVPAERLSFLLADSGARWAVLPDEPAPSHPGLEGFEGQVLRGSRLRTAASGVPLPAVALDSPAYCIYTSGTTGRPKGVVISHRNVVRLLHNDRFPFSFGSSDVWTLFHSYAFDVSVWELFGALSHGGRAVVVSEEHAKDPALFWDLVRRERVTVLSQTPSAFRSLIHALPHPAPAMDALRYVFFAGEALHPAVLTAWADRYAHVRLVNMYGATETTVHSSVHTVTRADIDANTSVIGVPQPTTTLFLLDRHTGRRLLPLGAVGEIHIGGEGVAEGYLNRPELTAERFVDSPFGPGRLFRSGDLASYGPNGALRYHARADSQLKLRGYRIEPAEIEACLRRHPAVTDAAVFAEDERLVAVVQSAEPPTAETLRDHLAATLPQYMVPSLFKTVTRMPLTPQGKLDLRTLRSTAAVLATPDRSEPLTPTATVLAEMWRLLLDTPPVGAEDSFFLLGGHSMLAVELTRRIAERFAVTLPVRAVFEQPLLRDLADLVDRELTAQTDESPELPDAVPSAGRVPAAAFQRGVWLAEQVEGRARHNVSLAWKTSGRLDPERLERAFALLVAGHEVLRTSFLAEDGVLHQVVDEPWRPRIDQLDLSASPDPDQVLTRRLHEEADHRFDPASGRLLRVSLAELGAGRQALLVCVHHLVIDGESVPVLLRELERCYTAAAHGAPPEPPSVQYRDFTAAQEALRGTPRHQAALAHWRTTLSGMPTHTHFPAPARPGPDGVVPVPLPPGLSDTLRPLLAKHNATPFMAFGAALALTLHRWTGQRSLTFGVPMTIRDRVRFKDLLGPCLNTVVLRSQTGPETDAPTATEGEEASDAFATALDAMRRELLAAAEHSAAAFPDVMDTLRPERVAGRTPYVDVMLSMNPRLDAPSVLGSALLEPYQPPSLLSHAPKFGLVLTVTERQGELTALLSYQGDRVAEADARALARDLARLLTQSTSERPVPAPSPACTPTPERSTRPAPQYRDFTETQETLPGTPRHRSDLAHWQQALAGAPAYTDFPVPERPEGNGVVDIPLSAKLPEIMRPLSARHGTSLYMAALTSLAVVLHRWSEAHDLVISSEMSNRVLPGLAEVLGPCQNTVALRSRIAENTTFLDALLALRGEVLAALEHAQTPFDDVVRLLNPPRLLGRTPYGDVSLEFQIATGGGAALVGGQALRSIRLGRTGAGFLGKTGVTVSLVLDGDKVSGRISYRGDRYRRQDMERLAADFGRTLGSLPDRLSEPVASPEERDARETPPPALVLHGRRDAPEAGSARTNRPDRSEAAAPPPVGLENRLLALWSKALDADGIGIHDNFFDLGGTSAALVQLRGALNAELGRELPVTWLFEHPTVEALVRSLTTEDGRQDAPEAAPPQRSAPERRRKLPGRRGRD
ncbi:amino acid adenylation domain-containing protein [Streptomyces bauhiniae]|uniref:amino acid adenylation domain-containing protein n=1 Tax=Streptomyces bauhiniae TaxID=2340725 RepID=UPI0035DF0C39